MKLHVGVAKAKILAPQCCDSHLISTPIRLEVSIIFSTTLDCYLFILVLMLCTYEHGPLHAVTGKDEGYTIVGRCHGYNIDGTQRQVIYLNTYYHMYWQR